MRDQLAGRTPAQAHHLRHAQPCGLRLKVSDKSLAERRTNLYFHGTSIGFAIARSNAPTIIRVSKQTLYVCGQSNKMG